MALSRVLAPTTADLSERPHSVPCKMPINAPGLTSGGGHPIITAMSTGRRSFIKGACLAGMCSCGSRRLLAAETAAETKPSAEAPAPAAMPQKWIASLLPLLAKGDKEYAKRLMKGCAQSHYEDLKMQATMDRFRGKLDAFLDFLRKEWGWIIEYDRQRGVIQVNENKATCVCPLVQKQHGDNLGILCHCSEGFNERMFAEAAGSPVRVEVTESILRGHKSCRYRIDLRASST
jgi:hypothetical protein